MQCPDGDTGVTIKNNLPQPDSSVFCFVFCFLPSTSLWGVYSKTFIHHYNIPLAHSFTDSSDFDHMLGQDISSIVQKTNGEQDGYSSTF